MIHFDLCGTIPIPSANGNKCLVTFVDNSSRMCWVYLLKTKSEAFQTFKNFHAWIENQAQALIGTFQFDNGKEYTSNELKIIFPNMGLHIKLQFLIILNKTM